MRSLPSGYRTASPDGKVITCYRGEETLGSITAKSTSREDLLAAEEAAVVACEKHAEGVASGKVKPAAAQASENKQIKQLQAAVTELTTANEQLAGANGALQARVAELEQELATLRANTATSETTPREPAEPAKSAKK